MKPRNLSFDQIMAIYNHIGEEERHFNNLELEYRKLASHWLLVSLGAIGIVLSKAEIVPVNVWALVIGICLAASSGILVIWFLDMKVYHELLHAAFKEGVFLEREFPDVLPQVRNNMVKSMYGGDIIRKVIYYYFFSILLLFVILNISIWMYFPESYLICFSVHLISAGLMILAFIYMRTRSIRDL